MLTVLHVDNNYFYKNIMRDLAIDEHFDCMYADDPDEAFEKLKNYEIDLIITCLEFENASGEEFINELNNSEYKNIPVIVLSSNDNIEVKNKIFKLGAVDYILKDMVAECFKDYIRNRKIRSSENEKIKDVRVAILDDDELELLLMKKILEINGILNVDCYKNPSKLLNSKDKYDIYLIDLVMPKISGEQVILQLRQHDENNIIIAVSAIENRKTISNVLYMGADDFIAKPFDERVFFSKLKSNLRIFLLQKELKKKKLEYEEAIRSDMVTRLYNYRYIIEKLEDKISRSEICKEKLSMIMLDIDGFRGINEIYGHEVGDKILAELGANIAECIRNIGIAGRYKDDKFIILLSGKNLEDACNIAENIRSVSSNIVIENNNNINISVSASVVEFNNESMDEFIKRADVLLYKAKINGKNRVEF